MKLCFPRFIRLLFTLFLYIIMPYKPYWTIHIHNYLIDIKIRKIDSILSNFIQFNHQKILFNLFNSLPTKKSLSTKHTLLIIHIHLLYLLLQVILLLLLLVLLWLLLLDSLIIELSSIILHNAILQLQVGKTVTFWVGYIRLQ